jgi:carbon monoxide dehydrogenase subunit G
VSYKITIPVDFGCPPGEVYEALSNLGRYPDWINGMTSVSPTGHMHPGLHYSTETQILGHTNRSEVVVKKMIPDRLITTQSRAGLVEFTNEYHLAEKAGGHCQLTLHVQMSLSPGVFNLARPVIEAVTEARIRGCLERLNTMLAERAWG